MKLNVNIQKKLDFYEKEQNGEIIVDSCFIFI